MSVSISQALYEKLKYSIPSKKISHFVNQAIMKELEMKDQELALAYEKADRDSERQSILCEWDVIDEFNQK